MAFCGGVRVRVHRADRDEAKQLADKAMAKAEREPAGPRHEALMKQAATARWMLEEFYVSGKRRIRQRQVRRT